MQNIALNNVSIVADINQIAIRVSSTLKICRKSGRKYRNYGSSNIHSIRTTLNKSIQYTVDGNKTRNGKLVVSSGCSADARTATEQFAQIRACGSRKSTILIQPFFDNDLCYFLWQFKASATTT